MSEDDDDNWEDENPFARLNQHLRDGVVWQSSVKFRDQSGKVFTVAFRARVENGVTLLESNWVDANMPLWEPVSAEDMQSVMGDARDARASARLVEGLAAVFDEAGEFREAGAVGLGPIVELAHSKYCAKCGDIWKLEFEFCPKCGLPLSLDG